MTNEQIGIYIRLLCSQHQHGGIINKVVFNSMVQGHNILTSKFIETDDGFYNARLMEEMTLRNKKSNNLSAAAKKAWEKRKNEIVKQPHSDGNTIAQQSDAIVMRKQSNRNGIVMPPENENIVVEYFIENGYREDVARKAFRYYSEANWHDSSGKKIRNWKQKMQSVWFKDENKIKVVNQQPFIF